MPRLRTVAMPTSPSNPASAASVAAAYKRAAQPFLVTYRATGQAVPVTGWAALCVLTGYAFGSLRVMLSRGQGAITLSLPNPTTDEPDSATIVRGPEPTAPPHPSSKRAQPKGRRGRPPSAKHSAQ